MSRAGLVNANIGLLINAASFVFALILLQCSKRTSWLSGDSERCNSLARCHWNHKIADYGWGLHLLNCQSFAVRIDWGITFVASNTSYSLEFSRPAALRMVTDVARIQCDAKWVDRLAFLFMRPSKSCKVFFPKGTLQYRTASLSLNSPVLLFLGLCRKVSSWGFASANTFLYIWLYIFPYCMVSHTLWLANYLRCHGSRQDDFLSLALEGQYIPGRLRFFWKQSLPLPYFSGFSASPAKVEHQIEPSSLN